MEQKIKEDNLNLTINVDRDNADYIHERQSLIDLVDRVYKKNLLMLKNLLKTTLTELLFQLT